MVREDDWIYKIESRYLQLISFLNCRDSNHICIHGCRYNWRWDAVI